MGGEAAEVLREVEEVPHLMGDKRKEIMPAFRSSAGERGQGIDRITRKFPGRLWRGVGKPS